MSLEQEIQVLKAEILLLEAQNKENRRQLAIKVKVKEWIANAGLDLDRAFD